MRKVIFAIVALGVFAIEPSYAVCTKPDVPSCAVTGSFASAAQWDQCRIQMLSYKDDMGAFAECLGGEERSDQIANDELEYTLSEFNRRSRELPSEKEED